MRSLRSVAVLRYVPMLCMCILGRAAAQQATGDPLSGLEELKNFRAMRASSSDPNWRNGNADSRPIAPGGTLTSSRT